MCFSFRCFHSPILEARAEIDLKNILFFEALNERKIAFETF